MCGHPIGTCEHSQTMVAMCDADVMSLQPEMAVCGADVMSLHLYRQ